MLSRRRANFSSASNFHRRAGADIAANIVHTLARRNTPTILRRPSSCLARRLLPTMQSHTPPKTPLISPATSCRWKRGRPVPVQYGSARNISSTVAMRSLQLSSQPTVQETNVDGRAPLDGQSASQRVTQTSAPDHFATQSTDRGSNSATVFEEKGVQKGAESPEGRAKGLTSSEETGIDRTSDSDYIPSQGTETGPAEQPDDEKEGDKEEVEEEASVEEHIDLDFQIPEDTLRTAMLAPENTRASFWSTRMYRGAEGQSLTTHYCRTKDVAERVAQYFLKEKVLGFDIEWRPFSSPYSIKQNASLIQLACEDRVALFHIALFPGITPEELMPPTLKAILESPDIYKVGVAVKGDFSRLQRFLNIDSQGVFELSRLHNVVEYHKTDAKKQQSKKLTKLASQVLQHLQLPLYKGEQLADDPADTANVRSSDWSKPLTLQQIHYAAADAYAGFRLYHILEWKRKQLRPTPPTWGICDYDAKAVPREKKPKKKASAKKGKVTDDVSAEDSTSALDQDQATNEDGAEAEEVDEESEDDYETAPEGSEDNSQLEEPAASSSSKMEPAAASNSNAIDEVSRTRKRVGRVNLSQLKGFERSDPGYPVLPQVHENLDASTASDVAEPAKEIQDLALSSDVPMHQETMPKDDDEFADTDLEEALQALDIDADGKLTETASPLTNKGAHEDAPSNTEVLETASEQDEESHGTDARNSEKQSALQDVEVTEQYAIHAEPVDLEKPSATSATTHAPLSVPADATPHSIKYNSASTWAQNYLMSTIPSPKSTTPSRIRATTQHLRAYHLWYHQNQSLDDVANELRDPPLPHSTVSGYILQAVTLERLEYNDDAMRDMLMGLPVGMRRGKWKWISEKVGVAK